MWLQKVQSDFDILGTWLHQKNKIKKKQKNMEYHDYHKLSANKKESSKTVVTEVQDLEYTVRDNNKIITDIGNRKIKVQVPLHMFIFWEQE